MLVVAAVLSRIVQIVVWLALRFLSFTCENYLPVYVVAYERQQVVRFEMLLSGLVAIVV